MSLMSLKFDIRTTFAKLWFVKTYLFLQNFNCSDSLETNIYFIILIQMGLFETLVSNMIRWGYLQENRIFHQNLWDFWRSSFLWPWRFKTLIVLEFAVSPTTFFLQLVFSPNCIFQLLRNPIMSRENFLLTEQFCQKSSFFWSYFEVMGPFYQVS